MSDPSRDVGFTRRAVKDWRRLDPTVQVRVRAALRRLDARDTSLDMRRLQGSKKIRVRVGDVRVIFGVEPDTGEIAVYRIVWRGAAYKSGE